MKAISLFALTFILTSPLFGQNALQGKKIVVDPGHGTLNFRGKLINPGKETPKGLPEHQLNMQISQKVGEQLEKAGAEVIYTRTPQDYWRTAYHSIEDNKARAFLANELKADVYLSIHCDWHPRRKYHGVTTFYAKKKSKRLGQHIHRNMVRTLRAKNRNLVREDFTVLDNADMPAVLIETGFMSHWRESKKLKNPAYQKKIARAILKGLKSYFK